MHQPAGMLAEYYEESFLQCFRQKKNPLPKQRIIYGRGGETRTRDTRFWRPVLYQLSYAPKVFLPLSLPIRQA